MKLPAIVLGIAFGIALAAATAQAAPAKVGLVGQERLELVQASIASCTQTARQNPDNQSLSDATITEYCTCYSNRISDKMHHDEIQLIAEKPEALRPLMGARIDAAIAACRPTRPEGLCRDGEPFGSRAKHHLMLSRGRPT